MTPIFQGTVEHGKIKIKNVQVFNNFLQHFEGKPIHLRISKPRKSRSNNQNSYYWGVIVKMLSDETGHFPDEIHEALKHKFLMNGLVAKSTTDLSTVESEDFYAKVRMWASADLNVYIPVPNEIDI